MLSARVHPGETNSSYMMKGAIDFLLGDTKEAATLRKHFVIRIIPMLNPDGVIYGNYRCSLLGVDLNRRWLNPNKFLHPTVFYAKRFMQYFSEEHEIALFCDMHGHSMKKNMFVYACGLKPHEVQDRNTNILIKMIPKLLAKTNKLFSFKDSHFRIESCKLSTARVVVFKELGVVNSYTLEASFYGPRTQAQLHNQDPGEEEEAEDSHMDTSHMETLGRDLCKVMLGFTSQRAFRAKLNEVTNALREEEVLVPHTQGKTVSIENQDVKPLLTPEPTNLPTFESIENPEEEEVFWSRIKAFEEKAYDVLYAQEPHCLSESKPTEEESQDEGSLDVQTAIAAIGEVENVPEDLGRGDEKSDSGGSDSLGSDNDDQKQEYIYRKQHTKKPRRHPKKLSVAVQKREGKAHSCIRHAHNEYSPGPQGLSRPKTPFVFGNYPDVKQSIKRSMNRIYKLRENYAVKGLQVDSPKATVHRQSRGSQDCVKVLPTEVLLTGFRNIEDAPKVRVVSGVGGCRNPGLPARVSFCPSTSTINTSKSPDLSLRVRTSRVLDAGYKDSPPHAKTKSKGALRPLAINPV